MNTQNSNIPYLIKQLLKEGREVYLPNVGVLSPVIESAYFDKISNKLYPPKYDYIFKEQGDVNNNLINRVIQNNLADKDNAEDVIQNYASKLFKEIIESGSSMIDGVGTLITNGSGVIFAHDEGLKDDYLKNLKPVYVDSPKDTVDTNTKPSSESSKTDWVPLLLGVLIGVLLLCGYYLFKGLIEIASVENTEINNYANAQSLNTDVIRLDTLETYTDDVDYLINDKTKTITHNYVIVTGNISKGENVDEMINLIESLDYQVGTKENTNLTRVGVLMSCDEVDVDDNLEEIKSRLSNDAWILDTES